MVKSLVKSINVAIAISAGILVLLGYFVPFLDFIQAPLIRLAVILAAVALLVGIANLFTVHWNKVSSRQPGGIYSLVLIISMLVTIVLVAWSGPTGDWSIWIVKYIQVPVEASLLALVAVVLAYASARFLRKRANVFSLVFFVTVIIFLIGAVPGILPKEISWISAIRSWISQVPAVAGARGILLGVALGTFAAGLRILLGADRPYGG